MDDSLHPSQRTIDLKGSEYLPVNMRLAWLVQDLKEGKIGGYDLVTEEIEHRIFQDPKRKTENAESRVRAVITIFDEDGERIMSASSIGTETLLDFRDYAEKADTKAVGRVLAMVGYGTQHSAADFEEGEKPSPIDGKVGPAVADAPVKKSKPAKKPAPKKPNASKQATTTVEEAPESEDDLKRKRGIVKWISDKKDAGDLEPYNLLVQAVQDFKTSSGLPKGQKVKPLELPLEKLNAVYQSAQGL